jgi:hypothetical protein
VKSGVPIVSSESGRPLPQIGVDPLPIEEVSPSFEAHEPRGAQALLERVDELVEARAQLLVRARRPQQGKEVVPPDSRGAVRRENAEQRSLEGGERDGALIRRHPRPPENLDAVTLRGGRNSHGKDRLHPTA